MERLIIASNRLPVKIDQEKSELQVTASSGGLATGLRSYHKNGNSLWIGWPGIDAETEEKRKQVELLLKVEHCLPVYLNQELIENFYEGFSNATLWPLFHYFTEYAKFREKYWQAYQTVNQKFAEAIIEKAGDDDMVWVHDYQLLLVPQMVREVRPDLNIGFFLHIPFPSYEVLRILPWREEIVRGLMGANLIGFHTYDYARHFLSSVKRLLGYEIEFNTVKMEDRQVYIDVFPMGIDYEKFYLKAKEIQAQKEEKRSKVHHDIGLLKLKQPNMKLILSIDRLDYTKGIPARIHAFREFLKNHPEYHEKVSLIMLIVPSREDVEQYQNLHKEINKLIGSLNGEFGSINWTPILYFYRAFPFDDLVELYCSADVALLTPLRDGMNLVAKEFIATKTDQTGVLVLSEMAGATNELGRSIFVNPNDIPLVAESIHKALTMPVEEQKEGIASMQDRLKRYSVFKWAAEFINSLKDIPKRQAISQARKVSQSLTKKIIADYKQADKRLLFLDYDGTLQRFFKDPEAARPDDELMNLLHSIQTSDNTEIVLISGRDKETLNDWFGNEQFTLIAEHGVWLKKVNEKWVERNQSSPHWKENIRPVLESFVDRTPGSFIEEKSHSLAWHYRSSDIELGNLRAKDLVANVSTLIINQELEILEGNKVIEIKVSGINKGSAAMEYLQNRDFDFLMAIGDDWTDEHLFEVMPQNAITIKVGSTHSEAKYYIDTYKNVRQLLRKIVGH